jgi:hypothetical protein
VRDFPNHLHVVRHPPFGDLRPEKFQHFRALRRLPSLGTTTSSGRSSHFGCATPMTGLGNVGVANREILDVNRGDPFAA